MPDPETMPPEGNAAASTPTRNLALGSSVSADLDALRNDVEQARAMACDYQQQLAGRSNDLAILRQLFEKTQGDLVHLNQGITQLREERHQLANEAMKAAALELKVQRLTRANERLQDENAALRKGRPAGHCESISVPFHETGSEFDVTIVPSESTGMSAVSRLRRRR